MALPPFQAVPNNSSLSMKNSIMTGVLPGTAHALQHRAGMGMGMDNHNHNHFGAPAPFAGMPHSYHGANLLSPTQQSLLMQQRAALASGMTSSLPRGAYPSEQALMMQSLLARAQAQQNSHPSVPPAAHVGMAARKPLPKQKGPVITPTGLDLLHSVASVQPKSLSAKKKIREKRTEKEAKKDSSAASLSSEEKKADDTAPGESASEDAPPGKRVYLEKAGDLDVLCGRGGKSNHHPGNKRYRQVVSEMKLSYRAIGTKSAKTDLSRAIVDHVYKYGGRFIKMEKAKGKYYVLSVAEGRKKTSQALREMKEDKWTM
jgi:hypothetical protein